MKKRSSRFYVRTGTLASAVGVAAFAVAQTPPPPATASGADPAPPPSPDQISYEFGLTFGTQLHGAGITNEVNVDSIARGLRDGLQGKMTTAADQQQIQAFVRSVQDKVVARNQAAATEFAANNAKEKGVVTTASGLQYRVLVAGEKRAPLIKPTDTVTVQYRGKLLDGTEFDSSYARNTPTTFPVTGVIKGWQEALVLMKPGAKWQVWVPPALGYGMTSRPKMPGGSLLTFEIEIMSVAAASDTPAAPAAPPGTPGIPPQH